MRIYLDNCCYNRHFDDQNQLRIRLETEAKLGVQEMVLLKKVELAWSYILDFENEMNPFAQRKIQIRRWRTLAAADTGETENIVGMAERLVEKGIRSKDALHLACAIALECDYFLTTDDFLIGKGVGISGIRITDPVTFVREALA